MRSEAYVRFASDSLGTVVKWQWELEMCSPVIIRKHEHFECDINFPGIRQRQIITYWRQTMTAKVSIFKQKNQWQLSIEDYTADEVIAVLNMRSVHIWKCLAEGELISGGKKRHSLQLNVT